MKRPFSFPAVAIGLCLLPSLAAVQVHGMTNSRQRTPAARSTDVARSAEAAGRNAGPTLSLTLADAVFLALRKNNSIRSAYVARVAQLFDLRVAEDIFTPHAAINGSFIHQSSGGVPTDTLDVAPSIQALTPTGATFNFTWDNTASRLPNLASASSTLSANVTQPLLKGAGLDVTLAPVRAARLAEDVNQLNLRQTVAQTITDVITAYRTLMISQEAERLAEDAVKRSQAQVSIDEALIQAGRLARMEIIQAQADLENQKLSVLQSQSQVDAARLALAALLNVDLEMKFVLRDKLNARPTSINIESALQLALRYRPDYLVQVNAIEQAKLGLVVADNQRLWNVSLVGNAILARGIQSASGSRPTSSRTADGFVGIKLSAPLNDLAPEQASIHATTALETARIQLAVTKQTVEQQVRLSAANIELNWLQVEAARHVVALAGSAVDNERQKLQAGKSSVFQVQFLEASYRAALVQSLNAEATYINSLTQFDLQLGTTLKTWDIALTDQQ